MCIRDSLYEVAVAKRKMGQISENDLLQLKLNALQGKADVTEAESNPVSYTHLVHYRTVGMFRNGHLLFTKQAPVSDNLFQTFLRCIHQHILLIFRRLHRIHTEKQLFQDFLFLIAQIPVTNQQ